MNYFEGTCVACGHAFACHDWQNNPDYRCCRSDCDCAGYVGEGDYEGVIIIDGVVNAT